MVTSLESYNKKNSLIKDMIGNQKDLVPLSKKMVKKASETMSLAFFNYPMIQYLFPNEKKRLKKSKRYFYGIINYGRLYGDAYTISDGSKGIIILLSKRVAHYPFKETIKSGIPLMFALSGIRFLLRTRIHERHQYNMYKMNTNFPHRYLMLLGVNPDYQGSGISRVLISKVLNICDSEKLPCYLETYLEKNVNIYKRFNFEVVAESKIPKTDIKFWGLLRK